jgi:peptidoglycan/xylan/chitin deacetylase (PgdA/CDA1 family)
MLGWFFFRVFLGPAQLRLARRGVPVFTYHKIASPPPATRDPFLFVTPHAFEAQLASLRRAGFVSGSLDAIASARDNDGKIAVITFDDGCVNVLEHGLGVLSRHKFRAIQFLVAGSLGGRNEWDIAKGDVAETLMDESQVRAWLAAGHEIGSHSMTHRNLKRLDRSAVREEIIASKKSLEDRFGVGVSHFCYPYGAWTEKVREMVQEAGYRTACTVCFGVNTSATPPHELRRIAPLTAAELLRKAWHRILI